MVKVANCESLEEVRANIDRLDRQIVALLAERGGYVKQAARFKKTEGDVRAPRRVAEVIANAVCLAREFSANPVVVEQVYRTMVSAFIQMELNEHAALHAGQPG